MQKRNYSRELDRIVEENRAVGRVPTLLLHACCAPCSSACLERLREDFLVTVYYYNPNITEAPEYEKRKAEEKRLIEEYNRQVRDQDFVFHKPLPQGSVKTGSSGSYSMYSTSRAHRIEILEAPYDPESFLAMAKGLENVPEGGERCFGCYALRLRRTADAARKYGFDYFSTTLTISPLKNADKLNEIGEKAAEEMRRSAAPGEKVPEFLPSDFKKKNGYLRSIELSKEFDLYRQNYCGCRFSRQQAFFAK